MECIPFVELNTINSSEEVIINPCIKFQHVPGRHSQHM